MQITLDEIKNELDINLIETSQDDFLNQLISAGKRLVENIAGRKFCDDYLIVQDYFKFPIIIRHSPAKNLVVKKTDTDENVTTLVLDIDYEVRNYIIYLDSDITSDIKKITLEYNIDDDFLEVKQIIKNYVKRVYKKNKVVGEKSSSNGEGTTNWEADITESEIETLRSYFASF
jgi:hypothetical protein